MHFWISSLNMSLAPLRRARLSIFLLAKRSNASAIKTSFSTRSSLRLIGPRQYSGVKDYRPTYQGEARYKFPDTTKDRYVLDVAKDHIKVHEVIYWIKHNKPRDLSAVISEDGYHYSRISSRVTSARGPNDVQLSRRYPSGPSPGPPPFSGNEQIQVKKTRNKETVWVDVLCPFEYEGGNSVLYSFPGSRSFSMMEEDDGEDVLIDKMFF